MSMQRRTFLKLSAAGAAAVGGASLLGPWQASAAEVRPLGTAPTTPFAVGVRLFNWSRGNRQIPTYVYYPALGTPGGSPINNAPAAPGVFPVCSSQHGYTSTPQRSLEHIVPMAAAGFIVPAPSLPRVSVGDASNGNLARDHSEVFTRTLALNTGGDPLAGHINTTVGVGMTGHSMGGMTTHSMLTAYPDSRIKAAIPHACVDMGNPSSLVKANVLFIHGDRDPTCPYSSARQAYAELPPAKAFLTFIGGNHGAGWGNTAPLAARTCVDWMRWSLYGDLAARDRLAADATSPSTRWEFVPGAGEPTPPPAGSGTRRRRRRRCVRARSTRITPASPAADSATAPTPSAPTPSSR